MRCGIDMIENQRVADSLARFDERFLRRFFTDGEQADCGKRPVLHLYGAAADLAAELGLTEWDISLTHTRTYAAAMVVAC